jgi:hypothetical protein
MKEKQISPLVTIFIFISIITALPFYESKRFSIWEAQEPKQNIFTQAVLKYSLFSESFKAQIGLNAFFEKDQEFWSKTKKSPILFEAPKIETEDNPISIQPIKDLLTDISKELEKNIPAPPSPEKEVVPEEKEPEEIVVPIAEQEIDNTIENTQETNIFKKEPPFRILIMGDSFMAVGGGLGDPIERTLLAYQDVTVSRFGRVSSGLTNSDYFNWNTNAETLISQFNPNVAIVMFGANDGQGIISSAGYPIKYGYPGWNEEYTKKVKYFINILEKNNITTFWIGLPIMRDAYFSSKMANLNSIYEAEIKNHTNTYFISTWESLADENGKYTAYMKDASGKARLIRSSDGVHLQYYAGYLLSDEIILRMQEVLALEKTP